MIIKPIKTQPVVAGKQTLFELLDEHIKTLSEKSIVVITSKVVSLCENNVVAIGDVTKEALIRQEADRYLPTANTYGITLTIKNNTLIPTAGIDESNTGGYYVLWPKDPQKTANEVRRYLIKRFGLTHVGVLITDSKTTPLRRGTTGLALAHSGFLALNNYVGKEDIFKRKLKVTKANIADGIAASAVVAMGEGSEQTPLATITEVPFVSFQSRNPTKKELAELTLSIDDDLYGQLLKSVNWQS